MKLQHKAVGMHGEGVKEVMAIVTRAQASKKRTEETQLREREKEEAAVTTPVMDPAGEDPVETPMAPDESAISSGPRAPRAAIEEPEQNWIEEGPGVAIDDELFEEKSSIDERLGLNISASDPSLSHICKIITRQGPEDELLNRLMVQDSMLWRRGQDMVSNEEFLQLVLPSQCRKAVLVLAHEIPLSGHLAKRKTLQRIL